jgi:hypothetical protein
MVSRVRLCGSVNVRLQVMQRKRQRPLRCLPKRWHFVLQLSQTIETAIFVSLIMGKEYNERSLFVNAKVEKKSPYWG